MRLLHWLLLKLAPETAHRVVIRLLKARQLLPIKAPGVRIVVTPRFVVVNRLGLAAGFDKNAEAFPALASLGFGFLEVGTVTPLPQAGNPKPRIFRHPGETLINRLGFNNCGVERFRENLARLKPSCPVPVLANVGKGKETPNEEATRDYERLFRELTGLVDGFVVNVSSPNTPGLRGLQNAEFLEKLAAVAPREVPVFVKLAPDLSDAEVLELCAQVARNDRFAGAVLTNTSRALAGAHEGGLSGPPLFGRSLECVALARQAMPRPKILIGVGGVSSPLDALRMRGTGADLVEIYTAFVYHGPRIVREITKSLEE